jgi:flagellar hook assembly protein FlgD
LAPGTYTLTYNTQVNSFAQADVPLTNNAQLNYSGGPTKSASVPITVIGNFSIAVNIYNSAGEVVKTIPLKQFSTAITNITLSTTNTITTLQGPGSSINILYDGVVIGTWDGTNNQGQPVGNGTYKVQIDNIASSGTVTSVSQNATVNRSIANVEVDIFNGAGEVVRKLYNVISNPVASNMTNVVLSAGIMKPSTSAPNGNLTSAVSIYVLDSSTPVTLVWDGTNDAASFVTPGEYQVQVHWTDGNGNTTNITKSILVLPSTSPSGKVLAEPNEIKGTTTFTTFDASGISGAAGLKVRIYTVAGEWIQTIPSSSNTVSWTPNGLASGLYIASVEVDNANGGMLVRQNVKVLILH